MKYFKIVGAFLLRLLFPLRCPVCDEILRRPGEGICRECRGTFRPISKPWCLRCGKQLLQGGMYCRECAEGEHVFVRGRSLYQYDSCAEAIYRFKYGGVENMGIISVRRLLSDWEILSAECLRMHWCPFHCIKSVFEREDIIRRRLWLWRSAGIRVYLWKTICLFG